MDLGHNCAWYGYVLCRKPYDLTAFFMAHSLNQKSVCLPIIEEKRTLTNRSFDDTPSMRSISSRGCTASRKRKNQCCTAIIPHKIGPNTGPRLINLPHLHSARHHLAIREDSTVRAAQTNLAEDLSLPARRPPPYAP